VAVSITASSRCRRSRSWTRGIGFQINGRLPIQTGPVRGPFRLYAGQALHDRIKVLMQLFGSAAGRVRGQ
jgi:hypothetical protein